MPVLVPSVQEFLASRERDTCFVKFEFPRNRYKRSADGNPFISKMLDWLESNGIAYHLVAPTGHIAGFPGVYALMFDDFEGPVWTRFLAEFETVDGVSKEPLAYNLYIVPYRSSTVILDDES